jgi:hypothetical protein
MAKVLAPNKQYDGFSATIKFSQGVGECTDPLLLDWFRNHGYTVEEEKTDPDAEKIADLKAYAEHYSFDIGNAKTVDSITKKLQKLTAEKIEELKKYAAEKAIDLGDSTSLEDITDKIKDAETANKEDT